MKKVRLREFVSTAHVNEVVVFDYLAQIGEKRESLESELSEELLQKLIEKFGIVKEWLRVEGETTMETACEVKLIDIEKQLFAHCFNFSDGNYRWYIVNERDEKIMGTPGDNVFSSVVPSMNTMPVMLTVNRYSKHGNGYERGVLKIEDNQLCPILDFSQEYDYIDGVDHGLIRVKKNNKWGIIGYNKNAGIFEVSLPVDFDNIWNFYGKTWNHVRAEIAGTTYDINLASLHAYGEVKTIECDGILRNDVRSKNEEKLQKISFRGVSIENFKFFSSKEQFDFHKNINIIVGKNNSGKSSCLNAIEIASSLFNNRIEDFAIKNKFEELHHKWDETGNTSISVGVGPCDLTLELQGSIEPTLIKIWHKNSNSTIEITSKELTFDWPGEKIEKLTLDGKWGYSNGNYQEGTVSSLIEIFRRKQMNNWQYEISKANGMCTNPERKPFKNILNALSEILICIERLSGIQHFGVFAANVKDDPENFFSKFHNKESIAHSFVRRWIQRMEIGDDYELSNNDTMIIYDGFGDSSPLLSMGTGSIHFVMLLLQVASIIFVAEENNRTRGGYFSPILLIEEPEQNLHPILQSRLADFLVDVSETYRRNIGRFANTTIIVETHSEYLVRKTQVIAKGDLKNIPFSITYFPSAKDGMSPYLMKYRENGTFERDFLPGFTDESFRLNLKLF